MLLILFAFVAGAGTAVTPCVLPTLPALLTASATGGRRRPLGIVLGLAVTFTLTVVGLAEVVDGVGVGDGILRTLAVVVLLAAGFALVIPAIGDRLEAPLSRLARFGPRTKGSGFVSGLGVGAALGFVHAPCAGPVLAAVITVGAASGQAVGVAIAYALGTSVVLLAICLGGRRVAIGLRGTARGPGLQRAMGAVLVLTALAVLSGLDVRFQTALAQHVPQVLVNPTGALERTGAVEGRLAKLRGAPRFAEAEKEEQAPGEAAAAATLPVLGVAPEFVGTQKWFNTDNGRALTLRELRGRVVLIDFWTYTCINCLRTLPVLRGLDQRYRDKGLSIVGVHSPEFAFEKDAGNVGTAVRRNRLRYPVVQDNAMATWTAWGNQYWPAKYLIDAQGNVRYTHFGEGDYEETEAAVRALLAEAGQKALGEDTVGDAGAETAGQEATAETYLGFQRAERFLPEPPQEGTRTYEGVGGDELPQSHFTLDGRWRADEESSTAVKDASLTARVVGRDVFLVLGSKGDRPRDVRVLLDGRPITAADAGDDVRDGKVVVRGQRLYRLVGLDDTEEHRLTLRFAPGVTGFAFTFG